MIFLPSWSCSTDNYRYVVNGVPMDFTDVTDDHHEMMTPEENEAYFEVASSIG